MVTSRSFAHYFPLAIALVEERSDPLSTLCVLSHGKAGREQALSVEGRLSSLRLL